MRVGLISDIHGNLLALDAVLAELECADVDQILCLGDVAVGPQPGEALARVRELGCRTIMGNWDAAFLGEMPEAKDQIGEMLVELAEWWAKELSSADHDFLASFEPTVELMAGATPVLFFHGSPKSFDDWIFSTTSDEDLRPMFDRVEHSVLVGGHTHVQMIRRYHDRVIANPGSVGLPFREWWPRPVLISPWAEYGILDVEDRRLSIDLRRTPFDVKSFLELSLASGMPHAQWWADSWAHE